MNRRLAEGHRWRIERLLRPLDPRDLSGTVQRRLDRAFATASRDGKAVGAVLAEQLGATRRRLRRFARRRDRASLSAREPPVFACDVSLAGLARWLRAAGYEAHVMHAADPAQSLAEAASRAFTLLTTDSRAVALRLARAPGAPLLWIPSDRTRLEQLEDVLAELNLPLREPRCMDCSGALEGVAKDAVLERIPPRTALWKDEYFLCSWCGKLYWRGTHWERIEARLRTLTEPGGGK
jgi:uncharacterized protein with PIN domain